MGRIFDPRGLKEDPQNKRVEQGEREQWAALRDADTLHLLPDEALIASIKHLAERLLELTEVGSDG